MGAYTIRELENLSGIKAHTIRIWEKRYGLIAPQRTSTNIRTYCDSELKKLLNISILNRNGFKISRIAKLTPEEMVARINEVTHESGNAEGHVENLTLAMIDLDEYRFEQVLARAIIQFGFEDAVTRVLYPFFMRIGLMWQTGTINPAQEHFVSSLVKQKFFVALDGLSGMGKPAMPRFVFFLPEGEMHELGLLFSCYLARKNGFRTIYLGQSLPLADLEDVVKNREIDFLYTSITSTFNGGQSDEYLRKLASTFAPRIIYLSGSMAERLSDDLPSNIRKLKTPEQFVQELKVIAKP
ncbi:MAG: MerR family transcriptional regulator [Bacteroidales bacterium]|nr:MerR family transcriptional regulator [Bacteroidales bacterium]